jgi:hypothetical protein
LMLEWLEADNSVFEGKASERFPIGLVCKDTRDFLPRNVRRKRRIPVKCYILYMACEDFALRCQKTNCP